MTPDYEYCKQNIEEASYIQFIGIEATNWSNKKNGNQTKACKTKHAKSVMLRPLSFLSFLRLNIPLPTPLLMTNSEIYMDEKQFLVFGKNYW